MLKIYSDFSIGLFILSVNYPVCGMSHRVSIYRADQGVEFHIRRCLGSVVYITSSRRTVQLGYVQGVYERFLIQKLIR